MAVQTNIKSTPKCLQVHLQLRAFIIIFLTWTSHLVWARGASTEELAVPREVPRALVRTPRGYCAPINRIVNPSSRCYEHLNSPKLNPNSNPSSSDEEELVYVRLETVGSRLDDLHTRPINELVAVGVLAHLFEPSTIGGETPDAVARPQAASSEISAQFWGRVANSSRQEQRLDDRCRLSVERLLCRLAYPSCHFRRSDASPLARPPCREDCLLVRDAICANLNWTKFAQALSVAFNTTLRSVLNELDLSVQSDLSIEAFRPSSLSKQGGANLNDKPHAYSPLNTSPASSIHFYWPHEHSLDRCESLPPLRTLFRSHHNRRFRAHPRWPICSDANLTQWPLVGPQIRTKAGQAATTRISHIEDSECLRSADGIEYSGSRNYTRSGLPCQDWLAQHPHKHPTAELLFDNMKDARNHCRNPGGLELIPWCYTGNSSVRWEYCLIEPCYSISLASS